MITVVNYGPISAYRIAAVVTSLGHRCQVLEPHETPTTAPSRVILSGGEPHVYESGAPSIPEWVIRGTMPVLGICFGMQLIAHHHGGRVERMVEQERGPMPIWIHRQGQLRARHRWMNRYDRVVSLPEGFRTLAVTHKGDIAAIGGRERWWGVQYHPEHPEHEDRALFRWFLR
jgi:GMP synthase (glutamine-hydrolysing)